MRLIENRITDDDLHEEMLMMEPWGKVIDGKLVAEMVFSEEFSENEDVSVYAFNIEDVVADFIKMNVGGISGKLGKEESGKAKIIISNLKLMIAQLEAVIPE